MRRRCGSSGRMSTAGPIAFHAALRSSRAAATGAASGSRRYTDAVHRSKQSLASTTAPASRPSGPSIRHARRQPRRRYVSRSLMRRVVRGSSASNSAARARAVAPDAPGAIRRGGHRRAAATDAKKAAFSTGSEVSWGRRGWPAGWPGARGGSRRPHSSPARTGPNGRRGAARSRARRSGSVGTTGPSAAPDRGTPARGARRPPRRARRRRRGPWHARGRCRPAVRSGKRGAPDQLVEVGSLDGDGGARCP